MRPLPLIALLLLAATATAQPTRYVTDSLKLDARSGPGLDNRIVRMVESGTPIEVLDEREGWSQVRLPGGEEAWILSRFLMDDPAARDRLSRSEAALADARRQAEEAAAQMQAVVAENERLREAGSELEREVESLAGELSDLQRTAGAAVAMRDENRALKARSAELEERYRILESENERLADARNRDWFLAGAGVLAGGILLGLIIPKLRLRRRGSWGGLGARAGPHGRPAREPSRTSGWTTTGCRCRQCSPIRPTATSATSRWSRCASPTATAPRDSATRTRWAGSAAERSRACCATTSRRC